MGKSVISASPFGRRKHHEEREQHFLLSRLATCQCGAECPEQGRAEYLCGSPLRGTALVANTFSHPSRVPGKRNACLMSCIAQNKMRHHGT